MAILVHERQKNASYRHSCFTAVLVGYFKQLFLAVLREPNGDGPSPFCRIYLSQNGNGLEADASYALLLSWSALSLSIHKKKYVFLLFSVCHAKAGCSSSNCHTRNNFWMRNCLSSYAAHFSFTFCAAYRVVLSAIFL